MEDQNNPNPRGELEINVFNASCAFAKEFEKITKTQCLIRIIHDVKLNTRKIYLSSNGDEIFGYFNHPYPGQIYVQSTQEDLPEKYARYLENRIPGLVVK